MEKKPVLLATYKQIREEALPTFYHENAFQCFVDLHCDDHKDVSAKALCWLITLGEFNASLITDFRMLLCPALQENTVSFPVGRGGGEDDGLVPEIIDSRPHKN